MRTSSLAAQFYSKSGCKTLRGLDLIRESTSYPGGRGGGGRAVAVQVACAVRVSACRKLACGIAA